MKTKKFKPVFTVDVTDCTNDRSVVVAFVKAKVNAGLPITEEELNTVICECAEVAAIGAADLALQLAPINITFTDMRNTEKKPNVFKRFWNWITRKK